jgi:hypothetical protein
MLVVFPEKMLECLMMGKTVESYRIALEGEINRWSGFARALRREDREVFDEPMDMRRGKLWKAATQPTP